MENAGRFNEYIERIYNLGHIDKIEVYVASRLIEHQKGIYPPTIDGLTSWIAGLRAAFSNLKVTIFELIESKDTTWSRMLLEGTHVGDFMGIAGSGKHFTIDWHDECRFHDSKIIEHWGVLDRFALIEQIRTEPGLAMPLEGGEQPVSLF